MIYHRARRKLVVRIMWFACAFLGTSHLMAEPTFTRETESQEVGRYDTLEQAQTAQDKFRREDATIEITTVEETTTLNTIAIGPVRNRKTAQKIAANLKSNRLDSWIQRVPGSTSFLVHAGAMQEQAFFDERKRKLEKLGYKNLEIAQKVLKKSRYSLLLTPVYIPPPAPQPKEIPPILTTFKPSNVGFLKGELTQWNDAQQSTSSNYFTAGYTAENASRSGRWLYAYGFRAELLEQTGKQRIQTSRADYMPTYLGYRTQNTRFRAGVMHVNWGSNPLINSILDQQTARDLSFNSSHSPSYLSKRATSMLHLQHSLGKLNIEMLWNPLFRGTQMPAHSTLWQPIQTAQGQMEGIKTNADLSTLIKSGTFATDSPSGSGGGGLLLSHKLKWAEQIFTVQYLRHGTPYYQINPQIQNILNQGVDAASAMDLSSGDTFTPNHPGSWMAGIQENGRGWAFEAAIFDQVPVTTDTYQMSAAPSLEWQTTALFHPGSPRTQATIGARGRHIGGDQKLLDFTSYIVAQGRLSHFSPGKTWTYSVDYRIGVDKIEISANPRLHYQANPNISADLDIFYFSGDVGTYGGIRKNQSAVILGWSAQF